MSDTNNEVEERRAERDDGLRRLLTWTIVALVAAVLLAIAVVTLVMYWFDAPAV
jgi:hypothetical protein